MKKLALTIAFAFTPIANLNALDTCTCPTPNQDAACSGNCKGADAGTLVIGGGSTGSPPPPPVIVLDADKLRLINDEFAKNLEEGKTPLFGMLDENAEASVELDQLKEYRVEQKRFTEMLDKAIEKEESRI